MVSGVEEAIVERLGQVPLDGPAADVLLAAFTEGDMDQPAGQDTPAAVGAYLKSVSVTGFRGIGPAARIDFRPGPGLTVVCGRNGSGKSSFAEALEVLLTGDIRRLRHRSEVWRSSWRCLHSPDQPQVSAELVMEGVKGTVTATCRWADGGKIDGGEVRLKVPGEADSGIGRLGWGQAMELYRPFLSHVELEAVLDKPSELHDQLNAILGLGGLAVIAGRLSATRKAAAATADAPQRLLVALRADLAGCPDSRASEASKLLARRTVDLDALESLSTGSGGPPDPTLATLTRLRSLNLPSAEDVAAASSALLQAADRIDAAGSASARSAQSTADLLATAVEHYGLHGAGDCPVCGRSGAMTDTWLAETRSRIDELRAQAAEIRAATLEGEAAVRRAGALFSAPPGALDGAAAAGVDATAVMEAWTAWAGPPPPDALRDLAQHLTRRHPTLAAAVADLESAALAEYTRRQDLWSPLAARLAAWCAAERDALSARDLVKEVKKAEAWLKDANHDLRNQRLRPYVDGAAGIWAQLRQESNVELVRISLEGAATRRTVDFDVRVDGQEAAGLGVMSQGEVNALALSVFLPRATSEESPLRFVVIDDPVQAMDPSKVDGMARVLAEVARTRQVIVFTHDDRLPAAIRRLDLPGRVIQVTRRAESVVDIQAAGDPAAQYLADAGKLAANDTVPAAVAARVIPGLCRNAIESASHDIVRLRRLARGDSHQSVEDAILEPTTLVTCLALAIFDDSTRGGDVYAWLNRQVEPWATETVKLCNKGAHTDTGAGMGQLVGRSRTLVERLRQKLP